MAFITLFSSGF